MTTTTSSLPESITSQLDTKNKKCRIGWKMTATGYASHGDWFPLGDEAMLQSNVDALNAEYAGSMSHWLEYE